MKRHKQKRLSYREVCCLLPSGNTDEFPKIRRQLSLRGVRYREFPLVGGSTIFVLDRDQLRKLPKDRHSRTGKVEPYLPVTEDSGHSLYSFDSFRDWALAGRSS